MRKLRVFESISIDGYFTDADDGMRWAHRGPDPEFDAWVGSNASGGGDAAVRSQDVRADGGVLADAARRRSRCPTVAKGMNAVTKYVVVVDAR